MTIRSCTVLSALLLTCFVEQVRSQSATSSKDPAQWALIYANNLEENSKALSSYTWQFGVAVTEGSELLYVDTFEATRTSEGVLVTEKMDHDLRIKERKGVLSRAGQEKRFAEIEGKIEFLKDVLRSYVFMSEGQVVDFFKSAKVTEAIGYDNALRVDGEGVLKAGDSVTLFGDRATARPLYLTFEVPYDAKTSANGSVQFRALRNSDVFYAAEISANFVEAKNPAKAKVINVEVESFDFQKK